MRDQCLHAFLPPATCLSSSARHGIPNPERLIEKSIHQLLSHDVTCPSYSTKNEVNQITVMQE
jgi:hypothetical protein